MPSNGGPKDGAVSEYGHFTEVPKNKSQLVRNRAGGYGPIDNTLRYANMLRKNINQIQAKRAHKDANSRKMLHNLSKNHYN